MTSFNLQKCRFFVATMALAIVIGIGFPARSQVATSGAGQSATNPATAKNTAKTDKKTSTSKVGADEKININKASADELARLPGIGKSKAQAIVDYRTKNGAFKSLADIEKVKGIKAGLFEKLKDHIKLSD